MPPLLTVQTGSLYASNDASTFSGTGGPFGFSPWTNEFGGIISSAGLATEPFNDTVYSVAAGDIVTFVIAVQNLGGTAAYDIRLQDVMPTGFIVPSDGLDLSVTDGTGEDLAFTGDLFSSAGLSITPSLGAYDANSGLNVDLVTFSLQASTALPGPNVTLQGTATLLNDAASTGGTNLAAANPASASTTIVTAAPIPVVTAETAPSAVALGQTIAFDVTLTVPAGTLQNLTIKPVLPAGTAWLDLVGSSVLSLGSALQLGVPTVNTDGSISFGTVTLSPTATGSATLAARFVLRADGVASGSATLQTVVSATATGQSTPWTATVANAVGVIAPPSPPVLSGLSTTIEAYTGQAVQPFAGLAVTDSNSTGVTTLVIVLENGTAGHLANPTIGTLDPTGSTYVVSGSLSAVQGAAQQLQFISTGAGAAQFTVTVVDSLGGVGQNAGTTLNIVSAPAANTLFDAAYYLAHNPDVAAAGCDPYQHYITYGWREGRAPNAWFDPRYYLTQNPDVAAAGCDPLQHYETYGWKEGRNPSLLFDDRAYLAANPDVAAGGLDPLLQYIAYGQAQGRADPLVGGLDAVDPMIQTNFYDAQLGASLIPTGAAGAEQAAWSYANGGWQRGLNPDAFFDTAYYLKQNPDVAAAGVDPLLHYETYGWKEGRNPSLLFDDRAYLAANPDVAAAGANPLLHYLEFGASEGRADPMVGGLSAVDPLVQAGFYDAQLGATLIPAGTLGAEQAAWSYANGGWQKGLNPDAWFDTSYYLKQNPDVAASGIPPLVHYETMGWKEGRNPSLLFNDQAYLAANPDVAAAGADPLLHYIVFGQTEGRSVSLAGSLSAADDLIQAAYYDPQLGATLIPTGLAGAEQAAWSYANGGWQRGLNPDPWFDSAYYLSHNPDVAAAGANPLLHYETYGWKEGRNPSAQFSTTKYLAANPDVAAAGIDPLLQYVDTGQYQNRAIYAV